MRLVVEEVRIGCSRVVDRLQLGPTHLDECVGVFDQLGDELHRYADASPDADDRKAAGITGEVAVGGLVRSGTADTKQPGRFAATSARQPG